MVVYIYGAQRGNSDMGHGAIPLTQRTSHYYDAVSRKFTGKERDSESGLDNFGARYDSSSMGRFMSPDPSRESVRLDNPQTWNRYSYVLNNPLELVDPTGELWDISGAAPQWADECSQNGICVNTIALNNTSNSVTVYGAQGADDVTTYQANADGMINMRDVSSNPSAQFDVAGGQPHPEDYLNPQAAAGLYNISDIYHEQFSSDSKVVMTARDRRQMANQQRKIMASLATSSIMGGKTQTCATWDPTVKRSGEILDRTAVTPSATVF